MLCILFLSLSVFSAASSAASPSSLRVVHANDRAADASRTLASIADNQASLFFLPNKGLAHEVSGSQWRAMPPMDRAAYVREMAHDTAATACFAGDPASFAHTYFAPERKISGLEGEVVASPSADGKRLGLAFQWQKRAAYFRLSACAAVMSKGQMERASAQPVAPPRGKGERALASAMPAAAEANGFLSLKADYERAPREAPGPWRAMGSAIAKNEPGAQDRFAAAMLDYYTADRFWCHAPWLERSAGMSDPADLLPAPRPTGGKAGLVLYNSEACRTLGRVFGAPRTGIYNPPRWAAAQFGEGSFLAQLWYGESTMPIQLDLYLRDESFEGEGESGGPWVRASFRVQEGASDKKMILRELRREGPLGMDRQLERARQNYETRYRGANP